MPFILYGILAVGSMAIALIVYALVMSGWCWCWCWCWCSSGSRLPLPSSTPAMAEGEKSLSVQSPYIASSFKYKKGVNLENTAATSEPADECVVCLTGFSDGEIVCQLPRCKHSFHSSCIDIWLYSHSDCPVCRSSVDRIDSERKSNAIEENSREVVLDIRSLS